MFPGPRGRWALAASALTLTLAACGGGSSGGGSAVASRWRLVLDRIAPALLSVAGTSASDVWIVGSDPGDGKGPMFLHYDGTKLERIPTAASGATGALWWVMADGQGRVWMAGEGGQVLRYDMASSQFTRTLAPSNEILYGIYAFSLTDVWACGGNPGQTTGVVWHWDGSSWSAPSDLDMSTTGQGGQGIRFFKVWGLAANDVWFVGDGGAALRRLNGAWSRIALPANRALFTVRGNSYAVMAVGGSVSGFLVEKSGNTLADATPAGLQQMNGIHLTERGDAVAVGLRGAVWRRDLLGGGGQGSSEWTRDTGAPAISGDYHAVYIDPDGGVWAVGGNLNTPLSDGVLGYDGTRTLPTTITTP